jgi:hypothetical protein
MFSPELWSFPQNEFLFRRTVQSSAKQKCFRKNCEVLARNAERAFLTSRREDTAALPGSPTMFHAAEGSPHHKPKGSNNYNTNQLEADPCGYIYGGGHARFHSAAML